MDAYIDSEYRLHTKNPAGNFRKVQIDFFLDKCQTYIEGHRYVPAGESWTREDGVVFTGEMICPWKDYNELDAVQRAYEQQLIKELQENSIPIFELEAAYQEGVNSAYG